jgi:hypothetical protein
MLQSRSDPSIEIGLRDRPRLIGGAIGGAITIDPEPDSAGIARVLREQIGVDPSNPSVVLNLAAIGITNGTWRNSPLEDWHGEGRICDGGMLRVNVATTKLVREVLTDHLGEIVGDEGVALTAIEDLADLEADFSDELFVSIFERLVDPVRVLPDGRTLRQLAGEDLDELVDHMDRALGAIAASAERHGLDFALLRAAAHGGLACSHWWGTPWWPDIVTEFLARLEDPDHPHWGKDRARYARLPTQPAEVVDRRQLRRLLVDAPEALSAEGAAYCVAAGIGFIHEPIRARKAAGTDGRA